MLWHKFEFLFEILHLLNIFEIEKNWKNISICFISKTNKITSIRLLIISFKELHLNQLFQHVLWRDTPLPVNVSSLATIIKIILFYVSQGTRDYVLDFLKFSILSSADYVMEKVSSRPFHEWN